MVRTYDGYGAILTEQVSLNGSLKDTWSQQHDAAGRRTGLTELNHSSKPFAYQYQADGLMTGVSFNSQNYSYSYDASGDGLLSSRATPFNTQTIVSRDTVGRILEENQVVGTGTYLDEKPQWRLDSTQSQYGATRTGTGAITSEARNYSYDDSTTQRGYLLSETFAASTSTTGTLTYQFDGGVTAGLGQRTSASLSGGLSGTNTSTFSTFARLTGQTVSGSLLQAPAIASPVSDSYDATGQLSTHAPGSSTTDNLTWDAFGRLMSVQRAPTGSGFTWSAVYDGFGRRLQTSETQGSGSPLVIQSSYDPEGGFMEAAVTVAGQRDWLVHGPDLDGGYGDLQGMGGVDAVVNDK